MSALTTDTNKETPTTPAVTLTDTKNGTPKTAAVVHGSASTDTLINSLEAALDAHDLSSFVCQCLKQKKRQKESWEETRSKIAAKLDQVLNSCDITPDTHPQIPQKNQMVPKRATIHFETWLQTAQSGESVPLTTQRLEKWAEAIMYHVYYQQYVACRDKMEEKYYRTHPLSLLAELEMWKVEFSKTKSEFEKKKADNLRHEMVQICCGV
ncbi:hypothetical protein HK104_005796 [Borealophlyctis nickersoniae]|nr:hypothetical protein HK104_005796 [Borealophlyctis nickersoniae]